MFILFLFIISVILYNLTFYDLIMSYDKTFLSNANSILHLVNTVDYVNLFLACYRMSEMMFYNCVHQHKLAVAEYSRIKFSRLFLVTLQAFCREKVGSI